MALNGLETMADYFADRLCHARIGGGTDAVDKESWYHIWEAIIAINAICVRENKDGIFWDLGLTIYPLDLILAH